jgi:hypothetical protein
VEEWISFVYYEEIKRDLNEHLYVSVGVMKPKALGFVESFFLHFFFFLGSGHSNRGAG